MAKATFLDPVASITGRLSNKNPREIISRRKMYRDQYGNILFEGTTESYVVQNPRDYNKTPMTQGEQKTTQAFRQAIEQFHIEKQDPERMAYWTARYRAQLEKGDPEAPIDKNTGEHRIYARLDNFIRAMLQIHFRQQ